MAIAEERRREEIRKYVAFGNKRANRAKYWLKRRLKRDIFGS